jgi:hypothetical protein
VRLGQWPKDEEFEWESFKLCVEVLEHGGLPHILQTLGTHPGWVPARCPISGLFFLPDLRVFARFLGFLIRKGGGLRRFLRGNRQGEGG